MTSQPTSPLFQRLRAADGAQVEIYVHSAHVTSWIPAGGVESLFLSRSSDLKPGAAIRGGVPVVFPQFSGLGGLPKHGFARTAGWQAEPGASPGRARFTLRETPATLALWPHPFLAEMGAAGEANRLELHLAVTNTGEAPFSFTAALHTYFRVEDCQQASVEGLQGTRYHDTTRTPWDEARQDEANLRFPGEVDRIYYDAPPVRLRTPARCLSVQAQGFRDLVAWNPGPVKAAALPDLDDYRQMVCLEAACIGSPVLLPPGGRWQGAQILTAEAS